jgi:hypothetical protein
MVKTPRPCGRSLKLTGLIFAAALLLKVNLLAQPGIIAFYPLDTNPNDYSGNGINGIAYNVDPADDRFGNPNHAYHFSGTNSAVIINDSLFKLNSYTYSVWCKPASLPPSGGFYSIFAMGGGTLDQSLLIGNYSSAGYIGFGTGSWDTFAVAHSCYVGTLPNIGQWYHIVVTRDNDSLKLYIDNNLICAQSTGTSAGYQGAPDDASIGSRIDTASQNFIGDIDDLKIFNRVLSATEIASLDSHAPVVWANFKKTVPINGITTTVEFDASSSVDVTVTTGGTHGITGTNRGDAGVRETGLSYDSLYVLAIFNGGGQYTAQTTIQFSNFHNIPVNAVGYCGVGNVNNYSSPVHVISSVGVGTWTQTGSTFKLGVDSIPISWNAANSQLEATVAGVGSDCRGITMSMGLLNQYTTVTLQLNQWLDDGITVWFGMTPGNPSSVVPHAITHTKRPALSFSGTPLANGPVHLDYNVVFPGAVRLAIHDIRGDLVRVIAERAVSSGMHHVVWDGRNQSSTMAPSGVYIVRLSAKSGTEALRIVRFH